MVPSDGGVGFQAAFIVCVSCHFGLDGSHQNACSDFLENEEAKIPLMGRNGTMGAKKLPALPPPDLVEQT